MLKIDSIVYSNPRIENTNDRVNEINLAFSFLRNDSPHNATSVIADEFNFELTKLNIIYGISGSGKSSVLRKISEKIDYCRLEEIVYEKQEVLINLIGKNTKEAIQIFAYCGLGEGNLFLKKISELSDGQRFRALLAIYIDSVLNKNEKRVLLIDEFGGLLDPEAAKGLAITISKAIRKIDNLKIVACCNSKDIVNSFNYTTLISLGLDSKVVVEKQRSDKNNGNTDLIVKRGTKEDYQQFKKFHYLDVDYKMNESLIYLVYSDSIPVGCGVFSRPIRDSVVKNNRYFEEINDNILTIYRIVIHPEYRGRGISKLLISEVQKKEKIKIINVLSSLFHYVPMPLSWGFENSDDIFDEYYLKNNPANKEISRKILNANFTLEDMHKKNKLEEFIKKYSPIQELEKLVHKDSMERAQSLIYYYLELMKKINKGSKQSFEKLLADFTTDISEKVTTEDIEEIVSNNQQAAYASYHKIY
jgi:ABC-type phosphate/phosphonate transport system ATPase subunit